MHRDPAVQAEHAWRYRTRRVLGPDERVTPLAAPAASIAVADLLP